MMLTLYTFSMIMHHKHHLKNQLCQVLCLPGSLLQPFQNIYLGQVAYIEQKIEFPKPVYHYATIQFLFEVIEVDFHTQTVTIEVEATNEEDEKVIEGTVSFVLRTFRIDE